MRVERPVSNGSIRAGHHQLRFFSMTPEMWQGSPQFAYDMYGPRSTSTISAFVQPAQARFRARRAARHAPHDDDFHVRNLPE
ncbi:MAG: hypothetical protein IPO57_14830 [Rhodocyclales bacterium]|nr:hypothetical protein [Rhodocyclales bacterium]